MTGRSEGSRAAVGSIEQSEESEPPEYEARRQALAARLQDLRAAAGMTVEQVARRAGLDPTTYALIEAGGPELNELTVEDLYNLADTLGVGIQTLVSDLPQGSSVSAD
jgi:transcriptional regulator with XRE-family HTH domain